MAQFQVTLPSVTIDVKADTQSAAWTKIARFFGKLADGWTGDEPDVAGLELSGTEVSIENVTAFGPVSDGEE